MKGELYESLLEYECDCLIVKKSVIAPNNFAKEIQICFKKSHSVCKWYQLIHSACIHMASGYETVR